jgi:hypothetical protein
LSPEPSLTLTQAQANELTKCKNDFVYFVTNYGYVIEPREPVSAKDPADLDFELYLKTFEPKSTLTTEILNELPQEITEQKPTELPFRLWDYQVRLARWLVWLLSKGESGAIQKARDMGATWLVIWFYVWLWRFRPNFYALLGSKKEAAVDNFKVGSLFGKLDYAIEKLPDWLKPKGYNRSKHRTRLSIVNPDNGSYLQGDSQTEGFGRSERYTSIFVDEDEWWEIDPSGSVAQSTSNVIYVSSVNAEGHGYRRRERLKARSPHLVQELRYDLNPNHTPAWLAQQESAMDSADLAREVLMDRKAAARGLYYPICDQVEILPLSWNSSWPSFLAIDWGVKDNMALIYWQKEPDRKALKPYKMMYAYQNSGKPLDWYLPFLTASLPEPLIPLKDQFGNKILNDDKTPVMIINPFEYNEHDIDFLTRLVSAGVANLTYRGDPAGRARNQQTAQTVIGVLSKEAIEVYTNTKDNDYLSRKSALTGVLMRSQVNSNGALPAFEAISKAKYKDQKESSESVAIPKAPVHDGTSHFRSAGEYFAVGETNQSFENILNSYRNMAKK